MNRLRIGVRLEALGLPLRPALLELTRLGVHGVQVDARGDLAPRRLSETGRREFRNLLKSHDLELTALNCPLRRGLDTPEDLQPRIDHVKDVMALSYDLGARVAIVQAGGVPGQDDPRSVYLTESLAALGKHGDRIGAVLALDTGLESGAELRLFLERFDTAGLGANLDPGNLLLHGHDPYQAVIELKERLVHAKARDVRRASTSRAAQEVPLGHGDIDWLQWLGALEQVEYRRWLVIERESGEKRVQDVKNAVAFLRRLIAA